MIGEFLLHPPFREKGQFLRLTGVCAILRDLGVRNNHVFRGLERDPSELWSLVKFHVSL